MTKHISKIYHIADIHIRNFKRHKEYREVFNKLFAYIKETKNDESIIYLGGDIVHSKTDMTPELVELSTYFLKSCADLCPTILISGNHDTNLSNQSRLDALSPLVKSLNHPNLYYWKDTGVYTLGDITFSVYSVFGSANNWIKPKDISADGLKIVLHHGAVFGAMTDLDHSINNELVKIDIFDGADLVLLGDIHKRQFLNKEQTIHYCGSLIQQSHGETLDKGITVWNINTKTPEFIKIENNHGYVTLHMSYGKVIDDKDYILSFPKKLRLRIKYEYTTKEQIQSVVSSIKKKHVIEEISLSKIKELDKFKDSSLALENVRDIEYQNKLITEYLNHNNVLNVDLDGIRHLNRIINSDLNSGVKLIRNIKWKPLKLEFSNMFSYGPGNMLDFAHLNGIQGIFAQNATGKSSLLDIFTYCIYDKCSRAWKAKDVLNNQKTKFKCKLDLELNGEIYSIERAGFKNDKKGNVKVEIDFYKIESDGSKLLLNGEDRDETNKIIRDYLGTYDDFLLTTLSTQNDNKNFIFKTQKERKDLLYSFLDLSVFDELQNIAKRSSKEKSDILSTIEIELSNSEYIGLDDNFSSITNEYNENKSILKTVQDEAQQLQDTLDILNTKLIPINSEINWDSSSELEVNNIDKDIQLYELKLKDILSKKIKLESFRGILQDKLSTYDTNLIESNLKLRSSIKDLIVKEELAISKLQQSKNINEELIKKLQHHEYDPNCKFCINNEFIKDAELAKSKLPEIIKLLNTKLEFNNLQKNEYNELEICEKLNREVMDINNQIQNNNQLLSNIKDEYNNAQTKMLMLQQKRSEMDLVYRLFQENLQSIEINMEINSKKEIITKDLLELKTKSNNVQLEVTRLYSKLEHISEKLKKREVLIQKAQELRKINNEYITYINMMSHDGIPYLILQKILPIIENEVNITLQEIVDFSIRFESDDKSNINCYLVYSNDNTWPVEMASGMERFIVSLAIRIALVDITSLPRPNFMAIDEGFGALDSDKITAMSSLFEYMRTKFDFIIAVSHVDTMRDMVDGLIDIHKNKQGFSEVVIM